MINLKETRTPNDIVKIIVGTLTENEVLYVVKERTCPKDVEDGNITYWKIFSKEIVSNFTFETMENLHCFYQTKKQIVLKNNCVFIYDKNDDVEYSYFDVMFYFGDINQAEIFFQKIKTK